MYLWLRKVLGSKILAYKLKLANQFSLMFAEDMKPLGQSKKLYYSTVGSTISALQNLSCTLMWDDREMSLGEFSTLSIFVTQLKKL